MATSAGGGSATRIAVPASGATVYPAWACSGRYFQMRKRWRGRCKGTDAWSAWSTWSSPSGSTSDHGWGDAWAHNVDDGRAGSMRYAQGIPESIDQATYDRKQYQVEVRRWDIANRTVGGMGVSGSHGNAATGTIDIVRLPVVTFPSVTFDPDGLTIAYSSDFLRAGNILSIEGVAVGGKPITRKPHAFKGLPREGFVTVPFGELAFIPDEGAPVSLSYSFSTVDQTVSGSVQSLVSYDANHGIALTVKQEMAEGYEVLAKLNASYAAQECHIVYQQDGETVIDDCERVPEGFRVVPPFDGDYDLFFKATGSGGAWGTKHVEGMRVGGAGHVLSHAGGWCRIVLFDDYEASISRSVERDGAAYQTHGRTYESVFLGNGSKSALRIECVVPIDPDDDPESSSLQDVRELARNGYATYRTPDGDRRSVAVMGFDERPHSPGLALVSIDLKERS